MQVKFLEKWNIGTVKERFELRICSLTISAKRVESTYMKNMSFLNVDSGQDEIAEWNVQTM